MTFVIGGGGVKRFHLTWDFDGRVGDGFCTMGYIIILDHFKTVIFDLQLKAIPKIFTNFHVFFKFLLEKDVIWGRGIRKTFLKDFSHSTPPNDIFFSQKVKDA